MASRTVSVALAAALAVAALAVRAEPPPADDARPSAPEPTATGSKPATTEPAVKRSVIEDDNARIDELRVRGAVRSTKVQPKGPIKAEYEVLPLDAGRDNVEGPHSGKGAAGQAVWRVLSF